MTPARRHSSNVIVSMTSFPAAIPFAVQAARSVLDGSVLPDKLVIYLTASQFPNGEIPPELAALRDENPVIDIRFYEENIRSYTKLIPALKDFPNDIIVTVDDDIIYHKNMLCDLLRRHKIFPDAVIAHRARRIKLNFPYRKWRKYRWYRFLTWSRRPQFYYLQTGVGGVLYPPNSLKREMLDSALFMNIAPTVDDIWFWAATVANGTKIAPIPFGGSKPFELDKPSELCLNTFNLKSKLKSKTDVNRDTLEKILELYPIIKQRIAGNINNKNRREINKPICCMKPFGARFNAYLALMQNALRGINIEPLPLRYAKSADYIWYHWIEKLYKKNNVLPQIKKHSDSGKKIIWNVHNKIPHGAKDDARAIEFMKTMAVIAHKIIIHSNETMNVLRDICEGEQTILDKAVLVPHPNYIGTYGAKVTGATLRNDKLSLCFFGAVKKYKNAELLISAINELNFDDVELNIIGRCRSITYARNLKRMIGKNGNIKMDIRFVDDKDIPQIAANCHLFVLPYDLDSSLNSGATILAFSYGRSVLSSRTGTLADIEDKSLFFDYTYNNEIEHKENLKKQIAAIRDKYKGNYNELLMLGEKCKEYVDNNNSLAQVASGLSKVFNIESLS